MCVRESMRERDRACEREKEHARERGQSSTRACEKEREHVCVRESMRARESMREREIALSAGVCWRMLMYAVIRQHTSAYVSIRQQREIALD
jgi:hypothetical protein